MGMKISQLDYSEYKGKTAANAENPPVRGS